MAALVGYAYRTAPKLVVKAAGGQLGKCLVVLAFEEYCLFAATTCVCQHGTGRGYLVERRQAAVYPGYVSAFDGEEKIPPRYEL